MKEPFFNLWDLAGILMISSILSLFFFMVGVLPFSFVAVIGLLFIGSMIFATMGSK